MTNNKPPANNGGDPASNSAADVTLAATTETKGRLAHPLAQQILECDDTQTERVRIEDWCTDLLVKSITAQEASAFAIDFHGMPDGSLEPLIYLIVRGVCDPKTGERIFTDDMTTRHMLATKQPGTLNDLARKVLRLSGLGKDDMSAHADAEKNS